MTKNSPFKSARSFLKSIVCLSSRQPSYNLTPVQRGAVVVGLSIIASSLAWALPDNVKVLKQSGDCYLVQTEHGREALYVEQSGQDIFIGFIGRIRKGTPLYHWGEATPEQAAKWNAAGRISPEILDSLIKTNVGAHGGGFYASLDQTDSITYGNTQITIEVPHDIKVVSKAANDSRVLNRPGVIGDIAKLGISALRNPNMTWFNVIDANALTQEHVTTSSELAHSWNNMSNRMSLVSKMPDILLVPKVKFENKRYLNYLNLLRSNDTKTLIQAMEYFYSIQDPDGLRLSLNSIAKNDPRNLRFLQVVKEIMKTPDDKFRRESLQFFHNWKTPQSVEIVNEYHKQNPRQDEFVAWLLYGRQDRASFRILKSLLGKKIAENDPIHDLFPTNKGAMFKILQGRSDAESLAYIKSEIEGINEGYDRINALKGRSDIQSLEFIETLVDINNVKYQVIDALYGRNEEKALDILQMILDKSSDDKTKRRALESLADRSDSRSLEIIEKHLKSSSKDVQRGAIYALRGRQDAKSLDIIKDIYKVTMRGEIDVSPGLAMEALLGRTDRESVAFIRELIESELSFISKQAQEILLLRNDQAAYKEFKDLIAKGKISAKVLQDNVSKYFEFSGYTTKQVEAEYSSSMLSEEQKYKLTKETVARSVEKHINAPMCKSIFSRN